MRRDYFPISPRRLVVGSEIVVRTRWGGLRRLRLRLVGTSSAGRAFVLGHNDHGVCHRAWTADIVHVGAPRG